MKMITKIFGFAIFIGFSFLFALDADEGNVRDVFKTSVPTPQAEGPTHSGQVPVIQASLQGIGMGPQGAYAVISGQVYHEGEDKQGIKIAKIRKKEVDIVVNGVPNTLRMIPVQPRAEMPSESGSSESGEFDKQGEPSKV